MKRMLAIVALVGLGLALWDVAARLRPPARRALNGAEPRRQTALLNLDLLLPGQP